jgi:nitrate reductase gamma subunit
MVPMVYFAVAVCIIGTILKLVNIFKAPPHPTTLKIYPEKKSKFIGTLLDGLLFPTVRRHKPLLWIFLMIFHIGLILLFIGHLELIWDLDIFQIIPHEPFLGKGFLGLILAVCLLFFLFRRFLSPVKELSVPEDYYLLILLFLIVIFGSEMDWARRIYFYEELSVEDYREYFTSLLTFKPVLPDGIIFSGHSFMLVLHTFLANLFLIFFPFSQSMHAFLSLPINKLRRG